MKFLEEIAALKDQATALRDNLAEALVAKNDLSDTIGSVALQLAEIQRRLADVPQPLSVKLNGQELQVSERDALKLFAALTLTLDHEEVTLPLVSGQDVKVKITDIELLAKAVLGAQQS